MLISLNVDELNSVLSKFALCMQIKHCSLSLCADS